MKKSVLLLFGLLLCYSGLSQDFEVNHCQISIYLSSDGYFDVVENYDLNFTAPKHGIFRDIRIKYDLLNEEGNQVNRRIKISNIDVPDHKFEADGSYMQKISDQIQIKIGDPDRTLTGPQHYTIKYRVYNAYLFEKSHIRFYWNFKPDAWNAIFHQVDFTIALPQSVDAKESDLSVYSGDMGATESGKDFDVRYSAGIFTGKSRDNFLSSPGQSVTLLLNLPVGSITEIKPFWPFWTDYGWTLILGALIAIFYGIWNKYGKDDKVIATTSYFPPDQIDPSLAGFLIDDKADTPDLISLIPHWGSRGIITMEQIPKTGWLGKDDTKLIRLKSLPPDAPSYEKTMFNGLFGGSFGEDEILVSSLKDSFYTTMSAAKTELQTSAKIYYDAKSDRVKLFTIIGLVIVGMALFFIFFFNWGILAVISLSIVEVFLFIMSFYLSKKNSKGNEIFSDLKGFKNFIKVAEENKLKMLLKDSPNYFETTMAYALAFGLFDRWAKKFESLNIPPPTWYSSPMGITSMSNFSQSFSDSIASPRSTMVSSPSSSSSGGGGGSSGGGFGGGGGGSW